MVDVEKDARLGGVHADFLFGGTVGGEVKLVEDFVPLDALEGDVR